MTASYYYQITQVVANHHNSHANVVIQAEPLSSDSLAICPYVGGNTEASRTAAKKRMFPKKVVLWRRLFVVESGDFRANLEKRVCSLQVLGQGEICGSNTWRDGCDMGCGTVPCTRNNGECVWGVGHFQI